MAAVSLIQTSVATLKNSLRSEFPGVKSSHLTEALAFALGYGTNAAMLAAMVGPESDRPVVSLSSAKMLDRLKEFGYPPDTEFDFESMNIDELPGVISTTCPHAHEIEYRTPREKAWRNLVVCAVNAGLEKRLFSLRPADNRFGDGQLFDFALPTGMLARGWVADAGFSELAVHVAINPKTDWVKVNNAGFSAGDAFATTWVERDEGAWIQTSTSSFRCRKVLLLDLAALDVEPRGFGDRGRVIM